ncbi:hypothetical protein D9M68_989700 [compost metagenome]
MAFFFRPVCALAVSDSPKIVIIYLGDHGPVNGVCDHRILAVAVGGEIEIDVGGHERIGPSKTFKLNAQGFAD